MDEDPVIPQYLLDGIDCMKIGSEKEQKLRHNALRVDVFVDPELFIIYWKTDIVIQARLKYNRVPTHIYLQDVVDVRIGETAHYHLPTSLQSSVRPEDVLTVVSNSDFTHPIYTVFVNHGKERRDLKPLADFLFKTALRVRRSQHGFLYHIKKRIAPLISGGFSQQVSFDDFAKFLLPSKRNSEITQLALKLTDLPPSLQERGVKGGFIPIDELKKDTLVVDLVLHVMHGDRMDLLNIFEEMRNHPHDYATRDKLLDFVNTTQKDQRRNKSIFAPMTRHVLDKILQKLGYNAIEPITFKVFVHFLWSDSMAETSALRYKLNLDDMHFPITHYMINSSHNTYCTGLQLKPLVQGAGGQHHSAKADVEIYRQILLSGCRCIELDVWDGNNNEPIITHGPTAIMRMNVVPLVAVCKAIAETAFKTSPYPIMLSIENHLCLTQQMRMVEIFREEFKEMLLTDPLPTHPLSCGVEPPSPTDLMYKILIKARKALQKHSIQRDFSKESLGKDEDSIIFPDKAPENNRKRSRAGSLMSQASIDEDNLIREKKFALNELEKRQVEARKLTVIAEAESETKLQLKPPPEEDSAFDLSAIVNYLQTGRSPKDWGQVDDRYYVMSSFSEETAVKLFASRTEARKAIRFNSRKMTRVYPSNWRYTSSNFDPMKCWLVGAQMAALNFQTNCASMLLNHAMFEQNGFSGFVVKSKVLRDPSLGFDPYSSKHRVQQMIPVKLHVKIISGHFLSSCCTDQLEALSTKVTVQVMDIDRRATYATIPAPEQCLYTKYSGEKMTFNKIRLSEMAYISFTIERKMGMDYEPFAHRMLPVEMINNGYHYVILRSEGNQNLGPSSLFVHFDIAYDMAAHQAALRADLANPFRLDEVNAEFGQALADPMNLSLDFESKMDLGTSDYKESFRVESNEAKVKISTGVRKVWNILSKTTM